MLNYLLMGVEDVTQFPSALLQLSPVRLGTWSIDGSRLTSRRIMNQVAVVVIETRKLGDCEG